MSHVYMYIIYVSRLQWYGQTWISIIKDYGTVKCQKACIDFWALYKIFKERCYIVCICYQICEACVHAMVYNHKVRDNNKGYNHITNTQQKQSVHSPLLKACMVRNRQNNYMIWLSASDQYYDMLFFYIYIFTKPLLIHLFYCLW